MREDYLLDYLCKCLDEINFHVENSPDFPWPEIESILKDLTGKSFYRNCVQLWTTYYNVSRRSDPKTTEEFIAFFNETESSDQQRLPTESLMILKKAHNIFGEEKCCMKNEVGLFESTCCNSPFLGPVSSILFKRADFYIQF